MVYKSIRPAGAFIFSLFLVAGLAQISILEQAKAEDPLMISEGRTASIEYTIKLEDGTIVMSNAGMDPVVYVHGSKSVMPGLQKGLEGMSVGQEKTITVIPEEGFGLVDESNIAEIKKSDFPLHVLEKGKQVQGRGPNGETVSAMVKDVKEETVILDLNHPLAGKTLTIDVKVLGIQETKEVVEE